MDPHWNINKNTYWTYYSKENVIEKDRVLKSENFEWDSKRPKELTYLCVKQICNDWNDNPTVKLPYRQNKELFLNLLSTELPLKSLIENIDDDLFWKRAYSEKFGLQNYNNGGERKWKNMFIEKYYQSVIENMIPMKYDPDQMINLVDLCKDYVYHLKIKSLIPMESKHETPRSPAYNEMIPQQYQRSSSKNANKQNLTSDHISLHGIIGHLTNLVELDITFQLNNVGVNYSNEQYHVTENDSKNLSLGLSKCNQLNILRITRSSLDCKTVKHVLRGLCEHPNLHTLDFSHCILQDEGVLKISKYIAKHDHIKTLILTDNLFGSNGAEGIAYALSQKGCLLKSLNLRLNTNMGSEGVAHIAVAIARGCNLNSLNLSACGVKQGHLSKPISSVWSSTSQDRPPSCGEILARAIGLGRTPLRNLDLSVNDFGTECDQVLEISLGSSLITDINLKRCGISETAIANIESSVAAQKLRRESEKGIRFRRSAGRVLQAQRIVRNMNIEADPMLLAQQLLSARPSLVSLASEDSSVQTQPLPTDFGFVPPLRNPLSSSRASSITGPPTSRRSSHQVLEPLKEVYKSALVRRGSDGSLLHPKSAERKITIFVTKDSDSEDGKSSHSTI